MFWPLSSSGLLSAVKGFLVMSVSSFRAAATIAWLDSIRRLPSKPCREGHREKLQNDHPALSQRLAEVLGAAGVEGIGAISGL